MANFVRRVVSGNKARFKDKHLDLELDLAYVTDHIIVMGFPATGVEGMYRNRRDHAKKFLDHRHGKDYWVFNFCPLRENSYPSSFFENRVSRYPFPDHHAPPLAVLPLFVREAREWISGSPDRVAVLHCKAGKGRSGTLACAYLLSLDETPTPPKLQRSMTKKGWAMQRADQVLELIETEGTDVEAQELEEVRAEEDKEVTSAIQEMSTASFPSSSDRISPREEDSGTTDNPRNTFPVVSTNALFDSDPSRSQGKETCDSADVPHSKKPFSLDDVLTLHASRRMKLPSSPGTKARYGVSIPSQRRWLHYWSQLLANAGPRNFWQATPSRVRLLNIRVRIRDVGGVKMNLVRLANHLIEKTNTAKYGEGQRGRGPVWVSLARYDDELVDALERWEKLTRSDDGDLGKGREGLASVSESCHLKELFMGGKWDRVKMIKRFAHLGHNEASPNIQRSEDGIVVCHTLQPLTEQKRELLREVMREPFADPVGIDSSDSVPTPDAQLSATSSDIELAQGINGTRQEQGVSLDAAREVRAKIYMGQVFMGWFWFIPAFHMPPVSSSAEQVPPPTTHFVLTRKEIDFPIGVGTSLVDVDIALEWIVPGREHR